MLLQSTVKFIEVIRFIREHRSNKVFCEWTTKDIVAAVGKALDEDSLVIVERHGKISAIAILSRGKGTIHVIALVTTHPDDFRTLLTVYLERFKGANITARRHGRFVKYPPAKLLRRLRETKDKIPAKA